MLGLSMLLKGMEMEIEELVIENKDEKEQYVKGILVSEKESSKCPDCGEESRKVQSQYMRTVADLPIVTIVVILILHIRRFFCENKECRRKIFAERLPLVKPHRRKTNRMEEALDVIARAEGGESGARTAKALAMKVSPDTMLRQIRRIKSLTAPTPKVLGVDEFAFKKGQNYGTILIDLEKHKRVDLLEDRSAESLAKWLKEHPGVEIISRDRGQIYADGARQGAPNAIHVADRFHLMQNLREAVERTLSSNYKELKETSLVISAQKASENSDTKILELESFTKEDIPKQEPKVETESKNSNTTEQQPLVTQCVGLSEEKTQGSKERKKRLKDENRERRLLLYKEVRELSEQGMSGRAIAKCLKINRDTVFRFLNTNRFPERVNPPRYSMIDKFVAYLHQRWESGIKNSRQLWEEIKKLGFAGGLTTVKDFLRTWRNPLPQDVQSKLAKTSVKVPSTKQVSFWLLGLSKEKTEEKKIEHQNFVKSLCNISDEIKKARLLGIEFIEIMRKRQGKYLDIWLEKAKSSGLTDLKSFASGIELDKEAVFNALTLEWSNGQVEGNNNRLKMLKRQMYGRANFDLLRARVLSPT